MAGLLSPSPVLSILLGMGMMVEVLKLADTCHCSSQVVKMSVNTDSSNQRQLITPVLQSEAKDRVRSEKVFTVVEGVGLELLRHVMGSDVRSGP